VLWDAHDGHLNRHGFLLSHPSSAEKLDGLGTNHQAPRPDIAVAPDIRSQHHQHASPSKVDLCFLCRFDIRLLSFAHSALSPRFSSILSFASLKGI
jgi:hypothetical protein